MKGTSISGSLVLAGLLALGSPASVQANEPVVTLKPMNDVHLPAGSQISEERLKAMSVKALALRAKLRAEQPKSLEETSPKTPDQ